MGFMARGVGGDGPAFDMPDFDLGGLFGGGGIGAAVGGAAGGIGAAVGGAADSIFGGLGGWFGSGGGIGDALGGGIGGAVGGGIGGALGGGIGGALGDWAPEVDPWMIGPSGGMGGWGQGDPMALNSDRALKRDIAPITGALDLF